MMWRMVVRWWLIGLVALICGACNAPTGWQAVGSPSSGVFVSSPAEPDTALLDDLRSLIREVPDRYESSQHRSLFGSFPYPDLDGDCLDTRDEVLFEEALRVTRTSWDGCEIYQGEWFDPFTNKTFTDRSQMEIDHVVSLSDAWDSGAWNWTSSDLIRFGNDLRNLNAIQASENRHKWAHGPAGYTPTNTAHGCAYVRQYGSVKSSWALSVSPADFAAIESTLQNC